LQHEQIQIVKAEMDSNDGILVTYSDGTIAGYVVEELIELRPHREPAEPLGAGAQEVAHGRGVHW
jgi:hypothetical protein